MPRKAGTPAKVKPSYQLVAFFAGRPGSQAETHTSKRETIRQLKRLLVQGQKGSKGSVTMIDSKGKRTLILQAEVAERGDGTLYVKELEL